MSDTQETLPDVLQDESDALRRLADGLNAERDGDEFPERLFNATVSDTIRIAKRLIVAVGEGWTGIDPETDDIEVSETWQS